jgi:multiple sugar transport system ATP-binding protein
MVEVRIEELNKTFSTPSGPEVAVDDIDLQINHGEFFTLVGPSGCGKTTTLRCIAGLETPTSGSIYFDDADVTDLSPQQRDIAMVFQSVTLFPHMTNYENIGYGLQVRGETDEYDEKIRNVAEILEISEVLDKKPGQLSGGQQQRVSLGRALVRDPNLVLFDEPLSDLDAKLKADLRVRIQRLHKEFNTTMIYVTHDQEEAMTMSDRIAVLNDGHIEQVSEPEELYQSPTNEFVGSFIGQPAMNILEATVRNGTVVADEGRPLQHLTLEDTGHGLPDGSSVRLGFRPYQVDITDDVERGFYTASLDVWEPVGEGYIVYLIDDHDNELKVVTDDIPTSKQGVRIGLVDPETVYLFDPETGEKIYEHKPAVAPAQ